MPRNRGRDYPADPPWVEEIISVMRIAGESIHGARVRALIAILWRAGLRINEALTLPRPTLSPGTDQSSGARARAVSAARSDWTTRDGSTSSRGERIGSRCQSDHSCA
jgi:hypothetical protein